MRFILIYIIISLSFCSCKKNNSINDNLTKNHYTDSLELIQLKETHLQNEKRRTKRHKYSEYEQFNSLQEALLDKNNVKKLYLGDSIKFNSFPIELLEFPNLEVLIFDGDSILKIPKFISKLDKLKELRFHYSHLQEIPPFIQELQNLERINMLGCNINYIPEEICNLKKLKEINLLTNNINTIPKCITDLPNLEILAVGDANNGKEISISEKIYFYKKLPNTMLSIH